jgi:acyl transferase domain-containing protein/NADPH:quinone reductase-like Zn-dependent oxidoreductase/short-subunit dehydrogenase/acyl carrier protein
MEASPQRSDNRSFPVAIIGTAFRFPGDLSDEHSFWDALKKQRDLITQVPSDRWATGELQHDKSSEPGRSITFSAGVLSRIDEFDAGFFGISPREAAWLDPQQRLLLELSWEAMENAGVLPSSMAGSDCAVYVGISGYDYGMRGLDDLASLSSHFMTGNTLSMAANRLSYVFDFHGPSLAIDTACSSSLVALHHACNGLRLGEASVAIVGGVNLLMHPYPFVGFSHASMISADGRSKPFDASANGYVRSEGGAVVLLKPLDKAIADGDDIQAVILASGVNTDGARKTGLTIPSRDGQIELMRNVLAQSGILSHEIDYLEAHGTGTPVGDPIEAAAIGAVYGQGRDQALPIGSVKANLGHMEPASGIASLIKAVLILKNRAIPPALHFHEPNPHIDFSELNLEVISEYRELENKNARPLVVGVNSFGFGGANAHILLQEPPSHTAETSVSSSVPLPPLFLSARSNEALRVLAKHYMTVLNGKPLCDYYDIAHAAAYRREHMEKRLAFLAGSCDDGVSLLARYAEGETPAEVITENCLSQPGSVAFIYSGNGAQWVGMGRRLLSESQQFREITTWLDSKIKPLAGYSVVEELNADGSAARLDDTVVAQPLLFVIQVACTLLLKDLGVEPAAVTGHSAGEIAAAWAAGALDLDQAIRIVIARSTAQGKTRGAGKMAAVGLSEVALKTVLAELGDDLNVTIAGVNSPDQLTLSGSLDDLERIQKHLRPKRVFFRLLDLDYAFHCRQMDTIEEGLLGSLNGLVPSPTEKTVFVSTVSGESLSGALLDAHYWWRNVREPVLFKEAVTKLAELGCRTFIEIGPQSILKHYIKECLASVDVEGRVLSILRKGADGQDRVIETALRAHLLADQPDLDIFFPKPGRRVRLPNYPWQRERHWHPRTSEGLMCIERRRVHPLLGWRLFDAEMTWENIIDPATMTWLADHRVDGTVVFPGSAYVELGLAAAREWLGGDHLAIEELDIVSPMVFADKHARTIRCILNPRDGGFLVQSRQRLSTDQWMLHAAGRVLETIDRQPVACLKAIPKPTKKIERETHYRLTAALGLDYGPTFQGFAEGSICDDRLDAVLNLPGNRDLEDGYLIHPALLDVCYQSLVDFFHADIESGRGDAYLPVKVGHIDRYHHAEVKGFRARLLRRGARSVLMDFELLDAAGGLVAKVSGCRFRIAPLARQGQQKVSRWSIVPKLCPHPLENQHTQLPSTRVLAELSHEGLAGLEMERLTWFKEALPLCEALTLSFVHEAFQFLAKKEPDGLQCLVESSSPFLRWLIGLLCAEGLLQEQDGLWSFAADNDLPEAKEIWNMLLQDNPSCLPQLTLLGRIGSRLPELLVDENLGRELLSDLQHSLVAEQLYDDDPAYLGMRIALENTLHHLASSLPEHRRLRVLEIAAGPSELPRKLLETLPEDRFDYVLALADEKYLHRQEVEYQKFANITLASFSYGEWELAADGPLAWNFDVVVLRNVVHKAGNLQEALAKARSWLSTGGVLLLAERYPDWSANILAGLEPNWWHEVMTGETGNTSSFISSLMTPETWVEALQNEGFDDIETFTEPAAEGVAAGAYLLIAKRPFHQGNTFPEPEAETWLLLVDEASKSLADNLHIRLENLGQRVVVSEQVENLSLDGVHHVVRFLGWNCAPENATNLFADLLRDVQLFSAYTDQSPRLWLLTRGGALASGLPLTWKADPVQSGIWGFGRVVMNEHPELNCTLINLAGEPDAPDMHLSLENELMYPDGENEIVLTGMARYTLVMQPAESPSSEVCDGKTRFRLDFHVPGKLHNLVWLPVEERPLQDDEIEVRTMATGLNFRDVMYVMGLLPDEAVENGFAGASLGLEFSGVVVRVGSAVHKYQPGDAVMGAGSSCFASHVITSSHTILPIPKGWSFEAAASVTTVYFTAYYALRHLADLQSGERVLIHGGAGGVGIAAIRLARHLGAEIFATAGSNEKRDFVRLLGVDHVFDSRSLTFADDILAATGGEGVDVVLNSLSGEPVRRNMRVLKPFGRFLELGKRDFYENTPIGLRYFRNNISYFGIDVDQLFLSRPQLTMRLFREILELFREGVLAPLPYRVFKNERVVNAFYEMMEARHIGKVIVSQGDAKPQIERPKLIEKHVHFEKETTWLVTGGLDGFGLESSRWLAARGVGNLVLISRRGEKSPGAKKAIAELTDQGVNVTAFACDVTDRRKLSELIDRVQKNMPPIKGILHAAMVLDDRLISNLDAERLEAVLLPKLMGAWNLHTLTLDLTLEYFVLYSSITTAIGNPGQANYVAANSALEGLAQMRRSMGLPATCVCWGPIGDAGYLTRSTAVRDSLSQRLGKSPLSAAEALNQLDKIFSSNDILATVANFDWGVLSRLLPSASSNRFAILNRKISGHGITEETTDFSALIANKDQKEISRIVRHFIIQNIAQVLHMKAELVETNTPLHDLGLDSLMAVELAQGMEQSFDLQVPIMMLNESPTVERLTSFIVEKLSGNTEDDVANPAEALVQDWARQHGENVEPSDIKHLVGDMKAHGMMKREYL